MNRRNRSDQAARLVFQFSAALSVVLLGGIFFLLLGSGFRFFEQVSPGQLFSDTVWNPSAYDAPFFGLGPMIRSTLLVTLGALTIAVPLGIGTAAWLSEFAPPAVRNVLKPVIELLAAVPSVVVGFLGIVLVAPLLSRVFGLSNGLNALNGAILLAIMSLPTIISMAEEAIRAVPKEYREASLALGANRWEVLVTVTLPACISGMLAAVMLGMGRVIGETMTVLMATGNAGALPDSFFDSVRTITATIAIEMGEVAYGSTHYRGLFILGALLFLITLAVNLTAEKIAARYRQLGR